MTTIPDDDIVERLREFSDWTIPDMIAEVDRLRAECRTLRNAAVTLDEENTRLRTELAEATGHICYANFQRLTKELADERKELAVAHKNIATLERCNTIMNAAHLRVSNELAEAREKALEALRWAWTNVTGRMPDSNTMTPAEIEEYQDKYAEVVQTAIEALTGAHPDVENHDAA